MKKGHIDYDTITIIAEKTKFQDITIEQVYWMSWILEELMLSGFQEDFALMGGSAIVFLYEDLYRLSVDIDIDFIGNPDLGRKSFDEIKLLQMNHISKIEQIAKKFSMKIKIADQKSRFVQLQLIYQSEFGPQRSIDLDLGYRYCHSVLSPNSIKWPNIFQDSEWPEFEVKVLAEEEIWASKLIATIGGTRMDSDDGKTYLGFKRKIRHLYDSYYLINNIIRKKKGNINIKLLKSIFLLFGASRIENFEFFRGDLISIYSYDDIETELFPVLRIRQNLPDLKELQRSLTSSLP